MTKALLIARREMGAYARSPLGAVIIAGALLIDGILFYYWGLSQKMLSAEVLSEFFYAASGITMAAGIILSMRLIAEERQTHTFTLLNTAPVRDSEIVLGKYLSAFGMLALLTVLTLYMPALIFVNGKVSIGHIAVGYLGLLLVGSATIAIGLFASSSHPFAGRRGHRRNGDPHFAHLALDARKRRRAADERFSGGNGVPSSEFRALPEGYPRVEGRRVLPRRHVLFSSLGDEGLGGTKVAMTDASGSTGGPRRPGSREGAPVWVVPLYVGGLLVLYLGERVLSAFDSGHWATSGLGLLAVVAATVARFVPTWQAGGERGRIEKLLGILSVIGVVALAVYGLSTDWGMGKLGLLTAADDKRERVHALLTIGWVILVCGSVLPMLFAEAALYPQRNADRLESRRVRAAAAAGLTLALAAVYGALFVYSAAGSEWKVDFSYFKTSEPSASTRKLVEGLNTPIRVVGFFPEVSPVRYEVESYLTKLAAGDAEPEGRDPGPLPRAEARQGDEDRPGRRHRHREGRGEAHRHRRHRHEGRRQEPEDARSRFPGRLYKLLRERRNIYLTVGHGEINDEDKSIHDDKQDSGRSAPRRS